MPLKERQDTRRSFAQFASDVMTRAEFKDAFSRITEMVKLAFSDFSARMDKRFQELDATEKELSARIDKKIRGVDGYTPVKGKDYTDGYTPIKGKDYTDGYTPIKGKDYFDGVTPVAGVHFQIPKPADEEAIAQRVASSVFPKMVEAFKKKSLAGSLRDTLAALEGSKRLPMSAIHGLEEHISRTGKTGSYYGGTAVSVMQAGTLKVQSAGTLDFKGAGAPTVTIGANGVTHLDFTGSVATLQATETPDGSTPVFTFPSATAQPSYLVLDYAQKPAIAKNGSVNWTWNAATLQATISIPPQEDLFAIQ